MPSSRNIDFNTSTKMGMNVTNGPVVLFDGGCNLCNHSVSYLLRHDKRRVFRFAGLQSDYARQLRAGSELYGQISDSLILYESGKIYMRTDAIIRIAEMMGGFYGLAVGFRIFPKSIRDALYNFIASHRYRWFGKGEKCMVTGGVNSERFLS